MLQASLFDGLSLDPFSSQQNGLAATEVDVGRGKIVETLMIAPMIVVFDEGDERPAEERPGTERPATSNCATPANAWADPSFGPRRSILFARLPEAAKAHGMTAPMSAKGNCFDNAMVETVFKTIKSEWSGERSSKPAKLPNWPLADISTASTIPAGDIPLWDTNRRHHSRP